MVNTCGSRLMTSTCSNSFSSERVFSVCCKSVRLSSVRSSSDNALARRDLPRRKGFTGTIAQSVIIYSQESLTHLQPVGFYHQDCSSVYSLQVFAYLNP